MKKLLSILGTITIAGSGISGLVGNAPSSAIKSEINYLQTNNLENLNRKKRQTGWNDSALDYNNYQLNNNLWNLGDVYANRDPNLNYYQRQEYYNNLRQQHNQEQERLANQRWQELNAENKRINAENSWLAIYKNTAIGMGAYKVT